LTIDAVFLSLRRGSYKKEPLQKSRARIMKEEGKYLDSGLWEEKGKVHFFGKKYFEELKKRGIEQVDIIVLR